MACRDISPEADSGSSETSDGQENADENHEQVPLCTQQGAKVKLEAGSFLLLPRWGSTMLFGNLILRKQALGNPSPEYKHVHVCPQATEYPTAVKVKQCGPNPTQKHVPLTQSWMREARLGHTHCVSPLMQAQSSHSSSTPVQLRPAVGVGCWLEGVPGRILGHWGCFLHVCGRHMHAVVLFSHPSSLGSHGLQYVRPLSLTISRSLPKFLSIASVISSSHLILCHPLLLLPSIFPSIRVFSNELALHIRWPKYWSFSFSISPSSEYSGLISFRMDCPRESQESSPAPQFKGISSLTLCLLYGAALTARRDHWEDRGLD